MPCPDRHPQVRRHSTSVPVTILYSFVQKDFVKGAIVGRTKCYPSCGITNEEILP